MGNSCTNRSSVRVTAIRHEKLTDLIEPTDLSRSVDVHKFRTDFIHWEDLSRFYLDKSYKDLNATDIPVIKWKKGEFIGEGEYSKVFQCMNIETGELVAVKQFYVIFT